MANRTNEGLSLSQFPTPECSTCKSCSFYTCGPCGTMYQEQNKIGQTCDCGGFPIYRTAIQPSCYKPTLKGDPALGNVQTCAEPFVLAPQSGKGSCSSCTGEYTCLEPGSTFDSGSTMARNLPCQLTPPVLPGYTPVIHKQLLHLSELDIYKYLQRGDIIVAAKNGDTIDYTMKKLQEHTLSGGQQGFPDFYYIDGPIIAMTRVDGKYFWMIDNPIRYNPQTFENYVNSSTNWNIAKTAFHAGRRLMNADSPVIVFSRHPQDFPLLVGTNKACQPYGTPQSNTDVYYPGCADSVCLWGPKYGSGNWLTRV